MFDPLRAIDLWASLSLSLVGIFNLIMACIQAKRGNSSKYEPLEISQDDEKESLLQPNHNRTSQKIKGDDEADLMDSDRENKNVITKINKDIS